MAPIRGARPAVAQSVYNRPFRTRANADARYDTLWVTPNRRTIGRDGTVFPAQRYERNRLTFARQQETTLADWYADAATGTIEVRIPWGMLHVLDPSSHVVLYGEPRAELPRGRSTEGFRFVVQSVDPTSPRDVSRQDLLPQSGATGFAAPSLWRWPGWEVPRWHSERKPAYTAMRATFAAIPDSGPPR
jgi:hypothetical protein